LLILCGLPTVVGTRNELQQRRFKLGIGVFPAPQESKESPLQAFRSGMEKQLSGRAKA